MRPRASRVTNILVLIGVLATPAYATSGEQAASQAARVAADAYLKPYVATNNFTGVVRVEREGKLVYEGAFGFADAARSAPNTVGTRFHVASVSMLFTAAAVMRLVDLGQVTLDAPIGNLVASVPGASAITVRDLLEERSGLPDINGLATYNDILDRHQTPQQLVDAIGGSPLLFTPGSKYVREEHSAYNALALLVERTTGLPFATAVNRLVFEPSGMARSGEDDDGVSPSDNMALGYAPEGVYGLVPAQAIHWSAKSGNASAYTTAGDLSQWIDGLFAGKVFSERSRAAVFDASHSVGYGWFKRNLDRYGEFAYYMNGRAPGFTSFAMYLPKAQLTIVVLSNIYCSATTSIGFDLAAIALGKPYQPFHVRLYNPSSERLAALAGTFLFGSDFYASNAELRLVPKADALWLEWPGGSTSALIPIDDDDYMDRSYWETVRIVRDAAGRASALVYGSFKGKRL